MFDNSFKKQEHIVFLRRLPPVEMQSWGGLENLMMDWFERIDYSSCRVTLAISQGGRDLFQGPLEKKGISINIIEYAFDLYGASKEIFKDMYRFLRPLKASRIIFVQGAFTDFRSPVILAGFLLKPNHVYMHENLSTPLPLLRSNSNQQWFVQRSLSLFRALCSHKVVVVSKEIKNQLVELWGYPKNKILVAYHGIDIKRFHPLAKNKDILRRSLNIPTDGFLFIIPARLAKEKCIIRAIEAFDRLALQQTDIRLLILGDGPLKQELQQQASQRSSKERIIFAGHQENVIDYLNAADCYVNSSDKEGLCIALLEAMACGLVCVATNTTGPTELIRDSQAGFLVEKNVEALMEGMKKAMSLNTQERQSLIGRGIQFTSHHFDVNRLVKNTLNAMHVPCNFGGV